MKKKDITYQEKLNELRLDISHPNNKGQAFILVEGDTDIRLFRKFFALDKCNVEFMPGGKKKLEEGIAELLKKTQSIMGIQDADFLHLGHIAYSSPNIFLTDFHDIETTILAQEEILNALVFEYTNLDKEKHAELLEQILRSIIHMSCLKWLNESEDLRLNFDLGFHYLVDLDTWEMDTLLYIQRLLENSPNAQLKDPIIIQARINELVASNPILLQVSNGHDALQMFAKYLRDKHARKGVKDSDLASSLRMAFNFETFKKTELYRHIETWAIQQNLAIFEV